MQLPNVRLARQPGRLKRLDKRIDELNRDGMPGDARFRPVATYGPGEQAHGCQSSARPPPPESAQNTHCLASGSWQGDH